MIPIVSKRAMIPSFLSGVQPGLLVLIARFLPVLPFVLPVPFPPPPEFDGDALVLLFEGVTLARLVGDGEGEAVGK